VTHFQEVNVRPLLVAVALALPALASAGTLRGTIFFPQESKPPEPRPLANWRVENGTLPILPAAAESRTDAVVVAEPARPAEPPAGRVAVECRGLKIEPRVVVAPVGSTFDFKNDDRLPRTLYLKDGENFMAREATAPGQTRSVKFTVAGEFEVRDADYPHATATLLVVPTAWFGRADDKGSFKLDLPDGAYTLKVYFRGVWAASQSVEVGDKKANEVLVRLKLPEDTGKR
jgi:hypothetical protein